MRVGKIPSRDEIEVYVTGDCGVAMKQISKMGESVVIVSPNDVQDLINLLQTAQKDAFNCEPGDDEDGDDET